MLVKYLFLIFFGCSFVYAKSDDLIDFLTNIKSEEQLHFIQYHVTRGFFKANNIDTKKYEHGYSEDYSKLMFETFLDLSKSQKQNPTEIASESNKTNVQTMICTPEGICFDPDDSGIHP